MTVLRLSLAQAAALERILVSAEAHYRAAAERATRSRDYNGADQAKLKAHEAAGLIHELKMAKFPTNPVASPVARFRS
jgi:hypothetical protein